jgi:GMP synthase (glutamine-hydrolysing)
MKRVYIIKAGTTFAATVDRFGDFDAWTIAGLGAVGLGVRTVDIEKGAALPALETCAGVVITGSHAMVTDRLPWSVAAEAWLPMVLDAGIPLLGICYGHQLMAQAFGGEVGFHPRGKEIGTVAVHLRDEAGGDLLFRGIPETFAAHVTHDQTVLRLPPGAVRLASNTFEPNHAFRLGEWAWGVQFHPEYNAPIMQNYIEAQAEALESTGRDVQQILRSVTDTPEAASLLKAFAGVIRRRSTTHCTQLPDASNPHL